MARTPYSLEKYAHSPIESSNGTTYTMDLWDADISGATHEWTLGSEGIQISYESEDADDKNSAILTSTCSVPIMVEDSTQEAYINEIRTNRKERDIWITIRRGTTGGFIWSGYVLIDLEVREDVSYPYETTLKAIDGLSALKDIPFLRETNSTTGATPSFPYERADTWDNAGYKTIIGFAGSWITVLLDNVGQLLATDDATGGGLLENYTIQTAFNWWNEDMGVSPSATEDPLSQMRLSMRPFYTERDDGYMDVPSCYDVLNMLCKNFNMRLIYWENTFHFIGIDEYNSDENVTYTGTFTPANIPTREYYYTGGASADRNYLGTTQYSLYKQVFENKTDPSEGLQKLAGSQYQALPAIKNIKGEYSELAGQNNYNGFPLFITHNSVTGLTTSWPTNTTHYEFIQAPQENGTYKWMEFTDAAALDGFLCQITVDVTNTMLNGDLNMETCWSMRAKPSSESSWTAAGNKVLKNVSGTLGWYAVETGTPAGIGGTDTMLTDRGHYIRNYRTLNAGGTPTVVTLFDSVTDGATANTDNLIPTHADFTGQWDFQFWTYTSYKYDSSTSPTPVSTEIGAFPVALNFYNGYSHGRAVFGAGLTATSLLFAKHRRPPYYEIDYTDSVNQAFSQPYVGMFVGMKDDFGIQTQIIEVKQEGDESFGYNIGKTVWGDGSGQNTTSTIQIYDGANWVYVDFTGKWAKGVYTWGGSSFSYASPTYNKRILNILAEEILYNQSKAILTLSTNSALSETNKTFPSSTRLKFMNPIARLEDVDGKKYIMKRGTFSLKLDQWQTDMMQMYYNTTSLTTGTRDIRSNGITPNVSNTGLLGPTI